MNEPRTIGFRYYNAILKDSQRFIKADHLDGISTGYEFTYKGEQISIDTDTINFIANSRREAESFLDMSQIQALTFARMLTRGEVDGHLNTKKYNE